MARKKAAVIQPFYVPWKGYFDIINSVDEFILLEGVQYRKRFWINRNRIKSAKGAVWLTIPVKVKGKFHQAIEDTEIYDPDWNLKHWEAIKRNYSQARYFNKYREQFEELYQQSGEAKIRCINNRFIRAVCDILGIDTRISWSGDYNLIEGKTERLVDLCRRVGAEIYLSGPTAREYLQEEQFEAAGIELKYMDYSGYPEYQQLHPPFVHDVSVIDLIFNTGPEATNYMLSFK